MNPLDFAGWSGQEADLRRRSFRQAVHHLVPRAIVDNEYGLALAVQLDSSFSRRGYAEVAALVPSTPPDFESAFATGRELQERLPWARD